MSVRLVLAKGREKSLLRRHPWVFSGAVARMEGKASLGETIDIVDHQGKWLARGAYSPASQIRARVWTFDKDETIDIDFFIRRLQQALWLHRWHQQVQKRFCFQVRRHLGYMRPTTWLWLRQNPFYVKSTYSILT